MMEDKCQLDKYGGCCCKCKWHWADYSHPCTDGKRVVEQRGWVCANQELFDGYNACVHSGWTEHGMCECFEKDD